MWWNEWKNIRHNNWFFIAEKCDKGRRKRNLLLWVYIGVNSVYPTGSYSEDNYTKCLTRLYHNSEDNLPISDTYTITEGATDTKVYIKEGYLNLTYFDLCFAGNNPNYDAYVVYTYNGL